LVVLSDISDFIALAGFETSHRFKGTNIELESLHTSSRYTKNLFEFLYKFHELKNILEKLQRPDKKINHIVNYSLKMTIGLKIDLHR